GRDGVRGTERRLERHRPRTAEASRARSRAGRATHAPARESPASLGRSLRQRATVRRMTHTDRSRPRVALASALALALAGALAAPRPAHAQTDGERAAAAQALFDQAMALMKADQNAAAC